VILIDPCAWTVLLRTNFRWSAICRGATEWGLEHVKAVTTSPLRTNKTVVSRLSRYSYGVVANQLFDPKVHKLSERYLEEATGKWRADSQMKWFLKRVSHDAVSETTNSATIPYPLPTAFHLLSAVENHDQLSTILRNADADYHYVHKEMK